MDEVSSRGVNGFGSGDVMASARNAHGCFHQSTHERDAPFTLLQDAESRTEVARLHLTFDDSGLPFFGAAETACCSTIRAGYSLQPPLELR